MSSKQTPEQEVYLNKNMGAKGSIIKEHHSMRHININKFHVILLLLLPLFFDSLLWINIESIIGLWQNIFVFWLEHIGINSKIIHINFSLLGLPVDLAFPELDTFYPTIGYVFVTLIICCVIFLISAMMPKKFLPISYFVRGLLFVHILSSFYFLLNNNFPYSINDYLASSLTLGIYLLFILPFVMSLIYYIFDFLLIKKIAVTALMLLYFIIYLPIKYLFLALIIKYFGITYLPLLYLNFGLLLDILMFICWYSWAMTL